MNNSYSKSNTIIAFEGKREQKNGEEVGYIKWTRKKSQQCIPRKKVIHYVVPSPLRHCSPIPEDEISYDQCNVVEKEIASILRKTSPNPLSYKSDSPYELKKSEDLSEEFDFDFDIDCDVDDDEYACCRCSNPGIFE